MKRLLRSRLVADYGSVFVLLLLCLYYSYATWSEQRPMTPRAGAKLVSRIVKEKGGAEKGGPVRIAIVVGTTDQDDQ
ncbi:MAG: hypothetical protein KDA60_18580, partial [Planctomycetales bacterium]|nr:hypothetical protein [Planctomycetales bacterium]